MKKFTLVAVAVLAVLAVFAASPAFAGTTKACKLHENCDMPCGNNNSDNIFKKSGRGLKKGLVKIKDGTVKAGRAVKRGVKKLGPND